MGVSGIQFLIEMMFDFTFSLSFLIIIVVSICFILLRRTKAPIQKVLLVLVLVPSVMVFLFSSFLWSRSEVFVKNSPTGEYKVVSRMIDVGAFGYRGYVVIVKNGVRRDTGFSMPCAVEWVSDDEIRLDSHDWQKDGVYNVNEWFK